MAETGRLLVVSTACLCRQTLTQCSADEQTIEKEAKIQDGKSKGKGKAQIPAQDDGTFSKPDLFKRPEPTRPTKAEALSRADGLAKGFILLGVASLGAEEGWTWVIEGTDEPTTCTFLLALSRYRSYRQSTTSNSCTSLQMRSLNLHLPTLSTITADGFAFLSRSLETPIRLPMRFLSQRTRRRNVGAGVRRSMRRNGGDCAGSRRGPGTSART